MFSHNPNLETVNISNSVTTIDIFAFNGCTGLTSVTIPNSVTSIGDCAFYGCSGMTSAIIGNSVTTIGYQAFYGCSSLTSVIIGNSITSIDEQAFSGCSGLISITCNAITPPILGKTAIPNNVTAIRVPSGSVNVYKSAPGWSYYSSKIQAI